MPFYEDFLCNGVSVMETLYKKFVKNFDDSYLFGWLFYFIVLVSTAILTDLPRINVWTTDLVRAAGDLGYGDPTYFAAAALDVSKFGWITEHTQWVFNLWPPGFVLLEALFLKVFGEAAPMPLIFLFCSVSIFSTLLMEMRRLLRISIGNLSWLLPLLIFLFPAARVFTLNITGLLFGEWLAIGAFFLAVLMLLRRSRNATVLAGFLFAVSAYARSQYEFFLVVTFLVSVFFVALAFLLRLKTKISYWETSKYLVYSMIIAQLLMAPWRVYHIVQSGDPRWVFTGNYLIESGLKTDEALISGGAGFLVEGGMNIPCRLAPEQCGKNSKEVYFQIFKDRAFEWISLKVQMLPKFWFSSANHRDLTSPKSNTPLEAFFNLVFLLCVIGSVAFLWIGRKVDSIMVWTGMTSGLVAAHLAIITFSHFEVRYFFFIKLYGLFSFIILYAEYAKSRFQKSEVSAG